MNRQKKEAQEKLRKAEEATRKIREKIDDTINLLDLRVINAYGIYIDPPEREDAIEIAIERLQTALCVMKETSWPTDKDYDVL